MDSTSSWTRIESVTESQSLGETLKAQGLAGGIMDALPSYILEKL